ncbi:hypothetical protein MFIFM68171_02362 [Madurella fahalii]|uniref:Uncharacterized protein n=1 Tax=Madurella fahalii TaxID=1157608 RepID=A0ABQ0G344_9PEZI
MKQDSQSATAVVEHMGTKWKKRIQNRFTRKHELSSPSSTVPQPYAQGAELGGSAAKLTDRSSFQEQPQRNLRVTEEVREIKTQQQRELQRVMDEKQKYIDNADLFLGMGMSQDEKIKEEFDVLFRRVRTWAARFSKDEPNLRNAPEDAKVCPNPTDKLLQELFNRFGRSYDKLEFMSIMKNTNHRRALANDLVVQRLCNTVFRNFGIGEHPGERGEDYWLEEDARKQLQDIERTIYNQVGKTVTHREYNDWRAITTNLLAKVQGESPEPTVPPNLQKDIDIINNILRPWENPDQNADELKSIVQNAIEFSQRMRCQRPRWSVVVSAPPPVLYFNPATMEIGKDAEKQMPDNANCLEVKFFIKPALYKRGNMGGEKFEDGDEVVKKAEVLVDRLLPYQTATRQGIIEGAACQKPKPPAQTLPTPSRSSGQETAPEGPTHNEEASKEIISQPTTTNPKTAVTEGPGPQQGNQSQAADNLQQVADQAHPPDKNPQETAGEGVPAPRKSQDTANGKPQEAITEETKPAIPRKPVPGGTITPVAATEKEAHREAAQPTGEEPFKE